MVLSEWSKDFEKDLAYSMAHKSHFAAHSRTLYLSGFFEKYFHTSLLCRSFPAQFLNKAVYVRAVKPLRKLSGGAALSG